MNIPTKHNYITRYLVVGILVVGLLFGLYNAILAEHNNLRFSVHTAISLEDRYPPLVSQGPHPPTDAFCRMKVKAPCYSPQEMRRAYGLTPLLDAGYTGKGQAIVIIESFGSPTIWQDLKMFDRGYSLPDPQLTILSPLGAVPFNPKHSDQVDWAFETSLDVEWAHALAPDARLVLLTSPIAQTEGVQGLPQFLALEKYALDHSLGKIISQSWVATENTLFDTAGRHLMDEFNNFYSQAASSNVTVLASVGDSGTANFDAKGKFYPFPTVNFPASSPYVLAVGGTSLYANTNGDYQSEVTWNEGKKGGTTGGGVSQHFKEPDYQNDNLPKSEQALLKHHRAVPDISYNADRFTPVLTYTSFLGSQLAGYRVGGGTSEGSPQWAGMIADANQLADHPLGFLNKTLYALGNSNHAQNDFHNITSGNNSFVSIPGYNAQRGWNMTTGWGSPKGLPLVLDLIRAKD